LSTINWTNRVVSDNFGIYGGNAATARAIVDRAIADWERVIVNFNYAGGGNTYNVNISAAPISGRGAASIQTQNAGKPTSANITLDDNGGGEGWYFDPVIGTSTVPDDGEFTNVLTPFHATFTGAGAASDDDDFYRTIAHELGHAMGISGGSSLLLDDNFTDIGADPNNAGNRLFAWNINGGAVEATFTNNTGLHLYEGPTILPGGTAHPNELMNPGRTVNAPPTERQLISDLTATILRDAYNYTIALPSTINTFYANLNTTTNVVTVTGDANQNGSDVDNIDLELTGVNTGDLRVEVNGTSEVFPNAEYTSIVVNAGEAGDDVDIDELESGKGVTINGGNGNDNINVAQEFGDIDTNLGSNVVINAGAGTDTLFFTDTSDGLGSDTIEINQSSVRKAVGTVIERQISYSSFERLVFNASGNANSFDVNSTLSTTDYVINGGGGNETFVLGDGDAFTTLDAAVTINGGGGSDTMTVDDSTRAVGSSYSIGSASILRTGALGSLNFSAVEDVTLTTGTAGDQVQQGGVASGTTFRLNTGNGADLINIGQDLDTNFFNATWILNAGAGTDSLILDDNLDALDDTYNITATSLSKSPDPVSISYLLVEDLTLNASNNNNTINFSNTSSLQTMRLNGLGGNDTFANSVLDLNNSVLGTVILAGGAGSDSVSLSDSGDATAGGYTLTSNSFQVTAGSTSAPINYSTVEAFTAITNNQPTPINVTSALSTVAYSLNGADGNDTFNIGGGDFDLNIDSTVTVNGGGGTDRVRIDDTTDAGGGILNINGGSFAKSTGTGAVNWSAGFLGGGNIEELLVDASGLGNTININGVGSTILQPFPNPSIDDPINVTINGNNGNDTITTPNGFIANFRGNVSVNGGGGTDTLFLDDSADAGNDTMTYSGGTFTKSDWSYALTAIAHDNIVVQAGSGNNTINLTNPNAFPTVRGGAGADIINVEGSFVGVSNVIDGEAGLDSVAVNTDAVGTTPVRFANSQDLNLLNIGLGGFVVQNSGNLLLDVQSTIINGRLDLSDGGFIDRAVAGENFYRTRLTTGYAGGAWTTAAQPAIISSAAAGGSAIDALGYGFASAVGAVNFFGSPVAAGDFLIRYTLYGDADLNGNVNLDDFTRLGAQFGLGGNWSQGNSNYDAFVNLDDFTALAANFGLSVPSEAPRNMRNIAKSIFSEQRFSEIAPVELLDAIAERQAIGDRIGDRMSVV